MSYVFYNDGNFYNLNTTSMCPLEKVKSGGEFVGYPAYGNADLVLHRFQVGIVEDTLFGNISPEERELVDKLEIVCVTDSLDLYRSLRERDITIVSRW